MQSPPYNLNKELPIPSGSPNRRRPSNNHRKGNKNATNGPKTTSNNSSNNLLAKLSTLNPLRSQPTTPTRTDSSSPFRIVHVPDRTPPYVPPGPRKPKTNVECREALEEMYAISRGQQEQEQGHATEENGDNSRTGLQMHPSNSYQHHRYVSIIQGTNSGYLEEEKEEEIVWISRTKPRDVKKRTRQMADSRDGSSFSRSRGRSSSSSSGGGGGGDGASNKKPPRRPPPPLPLNKDTKYTRSILPPGRLHIPPPPSTPNSAGPALETIPASPASPSSTPVHDAATTTTTTATTNFSWRGLTSAPLPLPPTPTTPSPPRAGGNNNMRRGGDRGPAGGRGHERVGSTGGSSLQGPLRAPRPLSERPLISPMSLSPQRPVTTAGRSGLSISPSRSPPVKLSQAATTVTTPTQPTFDSSRRSSSGNPREEPPIELRGYDELTTRRSRPRIPMCSVTEGGDFQHVIGDGGDVISSGSSSSQKSDHDGESWRGSGIAAPPVIPATRNRPGVSIFPTTTSSSTAPENDRLGLVCTTTPANVCGGGDYNRDTCGGGNCQDDYSLFPSHHHNNNKGGGGGDDDDDEQEYFEYSDSEYDETTPSSYSGHRRTLSPTMKKFPLPPSPIIAPTRPLRCGGGGGDWVAPWTPTRSPRGQMDFSPASPIPSSKETKTTFFIGSSHVMTPPPPPPPPLPTTTMGWSHVSSSSPAATARQQQQPPVGGAAAFPTPPSPHLLLPTTNNSPRPFSPPPARYNYYCQPGLRKGSASSHSTTSSSTSSYFVGGSSVVNEPPPPPRTRKSSSALFHLERSITNDPSWSPLVPAAGWPPAGKGYGHEVLRLGRVPSGEGHQVVVMVGSSADCSSRESRGSSSGGSGSSSRSGGGGGGDGEREEQTDEGGEGGVAAAAGSVQRPTWLAPREGGRGGDEGAQQGGDVLSSGGGGIDDGSTTDCYYHGHHDGEKEIYHYHQPDNSNSAAIVSGTAEEREAGGSYGDWFSYYAEETRQNNAAAAARYVYPLSHSFFFLPYFHFVPRFLIRKTGAGS